MVGSNNFLDPLSVPVDDERRHRTNTGILAELLSIDVYRVEIEFRKGHGELLDGRRESETWFTPRCPELDDHSLVAADLHRS